MCTQSADAQAQRDARCCSAGEDVEDLNFADRRVDEHVPQVKAIEKKKALGR